MYLTMLQELHNAKVAAMSAVVYVPAAVAMSLNSISARHFQERNWHAAAPTALTGVAFMLVPLGVRRGGQFAGIALIVVAAMGAWAVSGVHATPHALALVEALDQQHRHGCASCCDTLAGLVPLGVLHGGSVVDRWLRFLL